VAYELRAKRNYAWTVWNKAPVGSALRRFTLLNRSDELLPPSSWSGQQRAAVDLDRNGDGLADYPIPGSRTAELRPDGWRHRAHHSNRAARTLAHSLRPVLAAVARSDDGSSGNAVYECPAGAIASRTRTLAALIDGGVVF